MTAIADYQMQANAELSVVYYHGPQSGFQASMVRRLGGAGPFPQRFERLVVALRGDDG